MIRFNQQKQLKHKLIQRATQVQNNFCGGGIEGHAGNAGTAGQLHARGRHIGFIKEG